LSQALERQSPSIQELSNHDLALVGSKCITFAIRLVIAEEEKGDQKDEKILQFAKDLLVAASSPTQRFSREEDNVQ
jgi:hypothetical protein